MVNLIDFREPNGLRDTMVNLERHILLQSDV